MTRTACAVTRGSVFAALFALSGWLLVAVPAAEGTSPPKPSPAQRARVLEAYGKLPLSFEANQGQADPQVRFLARGAGYTLFLTPTEAVLALRGPRAGSGEASLAAALEDPTGPAALRMKLVGANPAPPVEGLDERPGKVHYYLGNDPRKWRTNIPTYARVQYRRVYPGVDLVYYVNRRQLEYDLVLAPGADPATIRLAFEGADTLEIDARGDLIVQSAGGEVRLRKPRIYQEIDGTRHSIAGGYIFRPLPGEDRHNYQVRFQVAAYDTGRPLVIDPVLDYSTYLGGTGNDSGSGIAVDGAGNAYITGSTSSIDFPTEKPASYPPGFLCSGGALCGPRDAFVTKLKADGSGLEFSTYLGGSGNDFGSGIAVDGADNTYITGGTSSMDFPTTMGAYDTFYNGGGDAFVTKLKADGTLGFSTYLGGSGSDFGSAIAVDFGGGASVTGSTSSINFPTEKPVNYPPAHPCSGGALCGTRDAFVTMLKFDGSGLGLSTYLGGDNIDGGFGITADSGNNAYVTGQTCSNNFPTKNPFQGTHQGGCDAFVARLSSIALPGLGLTYSTYLGGTGWELPRGISSDSFNNVYVTGETTSTTGFPTKDAYQGQHGGGTYDAFVTKLDPFQVGLNQLVYSTYLGGSGDDHGYGVAVDPSGAASVTGNTLSADFPKQNPLPEGATFSGGALSGDAFVTKFKPSGTALFYSTYLGGSGDDIGGGIAVDIFGNAYITGGTDSDPFPTTPGSYDTSYNGGGDAFVAKIIVECPPGGGGPFAYVGTFDFNVGNVVVIDTATHCVTATVPVGKDPHGVAVSPDGTRVYVTNRQDGTVSVIARNPNTNAHSVMATIPVGINFPNSSPQAVAVHPNGTRVYVGNRVEDTVSIITFDPKTNTHTVIATKFVGDAPHGIAINPNGKWVYVTNLNVDEVAIIDTATNDVLPVTVSVGDQPHGVAAHPNGTLIYVTNKGDDNISVIEFDPITNTHAEIAKGPAGAGDLSVAVHPDGTRVYVPHGNKTAVVDTSNNMLADTIPAGADLGVAATPDGKWVYLVKGIGYVSVIDTATNDVADAVLGLQDPKAFGQFIGPADRDGDGIMDPVDGFVDAANTFNDESTGFSNNFTDKHLGGTSFGSIVDRGGLTVLVWDAFNPDGLWIRATGGPGTATVNTCGLSAPVELTDGDVGLITCSSLTLQVVAGPIGIRLDASTIVSVPSGATVKVIEDPPGQFLVANVGNVTIEIVDSQGQVIASIGPGSSGTVPAPDSDGDGVPDDRDRCPGTPPGKRVGARGCSGEQLVNLACPCAGPPTGGSWKSHGAYVSCVIRAAEKVAQSGLITHREKHVIVHEAARSSCGRPADSDGDGVPDKRDHCPGTPAGQRVDGNGCSGEQRIQRACPCEGPVTGGSWKNHGAYVACVIREAERAAEVGLITKHEKRAMVHEAARSSCGKKK